MIFKSFLLIFVIFSVCLITSGYVAHTRQGTIRGAKKVTSDGHMYTYLGIPFARPPLGRLRFQPPQPVVKWKDTRDTITQKPQCVQSRSTYVRTDKIEGSEDCLYLNVYTPMDPSKRTDQVYPVMVWIHGGGFFEGDNGYDLYPPENFVAQNIIVVTVSYRLGIFGFISTGDLIAPGNNGLRDQIMALKWVNENIESFGGDKNSITIWGESSGGISVSHLLSSPLTKGLFHKAITESGASISAVGVGIDQPLLAFATGSLLNINATNSEELITQLQKVNFKELQAAASRAGIAITVEQPLIRYPFTVVIEPEHENAVLSKSPYAILENGEVPKVPILMGFNSNEGDGLPDAFARMALTASNLAPATLVPVGLNLNTPNDTNTANLVGALIKEHYFPRDTTNFAEPHFVHWYGDTHMIRPIIQQGLLLSKFTDVYFFEFNCIGYLGNPLRSNWNGVGHAEELNYLFKRLTQPTVLSAEDKLCSERVVKLWGNFVKYSNPTPENDPLLQEIIWPKTAPTPNMCYLHVDKNLSIRVNPDKEDFQFWTNIFETYGKRPLTTF
nr:carboxylesterase 1C-like [Onthophagus taurus]